MIFLERNVINNVVYTASEMVLNGQTSWFDITLTNQMTYDTYTSPIYNYSAHRDRYDLSMIGVFETKDNNNLLITQDTTIPANTIYVAFGDITIENGITLTNEGYILQFDGGMTGAGTYTGITGSILEQSSSNDIISNIYTLINEPGSILIFDVLNGYYDYTITEHNTNNLLEIGKCLIQQNVQVSSTYTPTVTSTVYEPNK